MTLSPVVASHWSILERTNPVVNPVVVSQKFQNVLTTHGKLRELATTEFRKIPASSPGPTVTVVCRCVGIAWKTQSETRGRAWQKMQKKVYDATKK